MGLEQHQARLNKSIIFPVGVILSAYPVSGEATTGGLILQISYPIEQGRFTISWQSRYRGLTFPISIMASGHCLYHSEKSDRKVGKVGSLPWVHNLWRCWIQVWIQDFGMAIGQVGWYRFRLHGNDKVKVNNSTFPDSRLPTPDSPSFRCNRNWYEFCNGSISMKAAKL